MAADFTLTNTRSLGTTTPVTAVPMTLACWFYSTNTAQQTFVSVGISGGTHRCMIQRNTTSQVSANAVGNISVVSTFTGSTIVTNTWNHACGVFASNTSRTAYFNGSAATTNTSTVTQNAFDDLRIGARWATTLGVGMRGLLAEVGVWNVALTAGEISSLADRINCSKIRPESLVFYSPLVREFIDTVGGSAITNNNSVLIGNHPSIYY